MSGYDYSHTDYVRGRPIISYDVGRGTRTYVTRIESRASTGYKYPTSHAKVDSSMFNHDRPPEVENFITQILNEVNGPPGLGSIPNPKPTWGRHSSPVKGYPTRDYYPSSPPVKSKILWDHGDPYDRKDRSPGLVYDQPPRRDSSIPNKGYLDQSHTKPKAPRDYGASREWDRSPHPADDPWSQYKSPNNWGNFYSSEDHEVPDKRWGKSSPSYDEQSPYNQPSKTWRDYSLGNNRWGISGGKPQSFDSYEIPRNSWDKPLSYDQPPLDGNASVAPKNSQKPQSYGPYGIHNNQQRRSSSPIHDYPLPDGNNTGEFPNSRWGSSLVKPQSPKGYGASSNQWYRSSSPIKDHSTPFSKNNGGVHDVPSSRWGNSSMKPQSPTGQGYSIDHWGRSLSPVHDHSPPRTNTGRLPSVPSSRWGSSLTKPPSPKGHENPSNHYRSLSPKHDPPPPTKKAGAPDDVPSSRWGNSLMKPQYPEVHRAPNNQWDRSLSPNDRRPPTKNTKGEPGVQSNGWDNSIMKPRSPKGYGASNNQRGKTSSPNRDHPPPTTKSTDGVHSAPRNQWDNLMNPRSPRDHGVPVEPWNRSSSPVQDHPPPTRNNGRVSEVPSNQWGNSLKKPQSFKDYDVPNNQWGKPSNPVLDHPPPSKNNGGALGMPSKEWDESMKPQPPNNQWGKSSNPVLDHPPPSKNSGGALGMPSKEQGDSMKPQPPKDYGAPNKQWNRSSSPSYDPPSPTKNYGSTSVKPQPFKNHEAPRSMIPKNDHTKPSGNTDRVLDNQWPNSPVKSQPPKDYGAPNIKLDRQSSLARDHSPLNGNFGGPPVKLPQSPKGGYNQWNRPSSSPTRNPIGVSSSKLGNSSVNPQSPRATSSPYDKPTGNNKDTQISKTKPDGYTYDQHPKDYGSKTGMKPSGYHSSPPRQTTNPPGKVTNTNIEPSSPNLKIETGRSPDYLTNSQSRNNSGYSYPASKEPIREAKSNIR